MSTFLDELAGDLHEVEEDVHLPRDVERFMANTP